MFGKNKGFVTDERLDHVAIITDGNGRWATKRGLSRGAGHIAGAAKIEPVLRFFAGIGVHHVTFYAFSTENWKRPKEEVDGLMKLMYKYLEDYGEKFGKDSEYCIRFLGDKSALPDYLAEKCKEVEAASEQKAFVCNIALNYGGRDDIVHAANEALKAGHGKLSEDLISKYTYTSHSPDPDLVIRTGGDFRISNFLLWQSAYSEFTILDKLWPDITEKDLMKCVKNFYKRNRRFGGIEQK